MRLELKHGDRGPVIERLHRALAAAGYAVEVTESERAEFGASTAEALHALRRHHRLPEADHIDDTVLAILFEAERTINVTINKQAQQTPAPPADPRHGSVTGRLVDQDGAPIAGMSVQLLSMTLTAQHQLASSQTDKSGAFAFHYERTKPLNLIAHAVNDLGDVVASSATLFAAAAAVTINLTTATDGVVRAPSQYTLLT
jgi:hypothetical protein